MIVLKNEMFSCVACLYTNKAQRCSHLKDEYLVSTKSTSKAYIRNSDTSAPQKISGYYRLKIHNNHRSPLVRRKILPQNHQNDEILFHRDLNVDTASSVGPIIYVLDEKTPIELESFIPTYDLPVDNYDSMSSFKKLVVDFKFNKAKGGTSKETPEWETVLIRPFQDSYKPLTSIADTSENRASIPLILENNHIQDAYKVPGTKVTLLTKKTNFLQGADSNDAIEVVEPLKSKHSQRLLSSSKQKMEEFLQETERFLDSFLNPNTERQRSFANDLQV